MKELSKTLLLFVISLTANANLTSSNDLVNFEKIKVSKYEKQYIQIMNMGNDYSEFEVAHNCKKQFRIDANDCDGLSPEMGCWIELRYAPRKIEEGSCTISIMDDLDAELDIEIFYNSIPKK
jgi:hypothetical protein